MFLFLCISAVILYVLVYGIWYNVYDGVILSHLEPDILDVKSSGPYEASLRTKLVEVIELQLSYFESKDGAVKVLHSICQQIWKTQQ